MDNKPLVVTQSNIITNASYKLTLTEQRVLLLVMSKIESKNTDYCQNAEFKITADKFSKVFGVHSKTAYRELREVGDKLFERKLTFQLGKGKYVKTRWVSDVTYNKEEGSITLNLAPKMVPLLTQLTEKFTTYHLAHAINFKSAYSHRLYQLLVQWKSVGIIKIPLEGLRQRLELEGDYYLEYKHLKQKIIKPCLEEINKYSDLQVTLKEIKEGRSVKAIALSFREKVAKKSSTTHKSQPKAVFAESTEVQSRLSDGDINNALSGILKNIVRPITIN